MASNLEEKCIICVLFGSLQHLRRGQVSQLGGAAPSRSSLPSLLLWSLQYCASSPGLLPSHGQDPTAVPASWNGLKTEQKVLRAHYEFVNVYYSRCLPAPKQKLTGQTSVLQAPKEFSLMLMQKKFPRQS